MVKRYPTTLYLDLSDKNEVYSITLPADTKAYTLKTRGNTQFKVAYANGGIAAGNYITVPSGSAESEDNLSREDPITIYVQGEVDLEVLEYKLWR